MKNVRFLWDNLIDVADLLASSEEAEFPIENIAHELFLKAWRSTGIVSGATAGTASRGSRVRTSFHCGTCASSPNRSLTAAARASLDVGSP